MFFRKAVIPVSALALASCVFGQGQPPSDPQPPPDPAEQQYPPQQPDRAPQPDQPQQGPNDGSWRPLGQGQTSSTGQPGYGGPTAQYPNTQPPYMQQDQQSQPYPPARTQSAPGPYNNRPYNTQQSPYKQPPAPPIPAQLTIPAGTFLNVRLDQAVSSDHNQAGDAFPATLAQPLVVNGIVVAEPGQTIAGRVVEAQKAGRVEGTSRLRVQLTELTLVDGQQVPLQSQFINRKGGTSIGRDAGAIAGTTGLGAAIGAAAGSGPGAAIGAGAGAVVGTVGVLFTRGRPTVLGPEQALTFRIEAPITINTTPGTQAFRYVQPDEYDRPTYNRPPAGNYGYGAPVAVAAPPPYYGYPYSPYAYGPGFSFFFGPGYYRPYYGRGFYGGYGYRRR